MRRGSWLRLGALSLVLVLAACGSRTVQETLGLSRRVPDEFQVVRQPPLVVPPELRGAELPPPDPQAAGPMGDVRAQARAVLLGEGKAASGPLSPGERALLEAIRVAPLPDIRRRLVAENEELVELSEDRFLMILDFQRDQFRPKGTPLDPYAEAKRLEAEGRVRHVVTIRRRSEPLAPEEAR